MSLVDLSENARRVGGSMTLRGVLVRPTGRGPWPGVVMIHEVFGVDAVMQRQAVRLASAGYLTLAVDLFSDGGAVRCLVSTMRALLSGEGRAVADIEASRTHLLESPDCSGKVGVIGFCMGGGFALLSATAGFDVVSANYGQLPRHLDDAFEGACPIVASYGGRDRGMRGASQRLAQALTRAGVVHDVKEYAAAGHSFLNDSETGPRVLRPLLRVAGVGPEPEAAADAWARIETFFRTYLR